MSDTAHAGSFLACISSLPGALLSCVCPAAVGLSRVPMCLAGHLGCQLKTAFASVPLLRQERGLRRGRTGLGLKSHGWWLPSPQSAAPLAILGWELRSCCCHKSFVFHPRGSHIKSGIAKESRRGTAGFFFFFLTYICIPQSGVTPGLPCPFTGAVRG